MGRNNDDFYDSQHLATDPVAQSKAGSLHKGKSGYYEEHHSSSRYVGGCKSCMNEEKSGKHPLA